MSLNIAETIRDIRSHVANAKSRQETTCVVPTMGGLHSGHLALIEHACRISDHVIVTLFVNPTQFDNPEDFENYPGNNTEDLALLEKTGAKTVFMPTADEMYPKHFSTTVLVNAGKAILCDAHRPGHFDGVATVCTKLFLQTGADYACFGEKDFQQLFIVKTLVKDLNLPIEIVPVATVREKDGLAMSSRNRRLSDLERKVAPRLNKIMRNTAEKLRSGYSPAEVCEEGIQELNKDHVFRVEYFEARSAKTLELIQQYEAGARLFAAAWLGNVRLIDNIEI